MVDEERLWRPILEGLKVVELTEGMAGALAGMVLADNGASVVKVVLADAPVPPSDGYLMWDRGKRLVSSSTEDAVGGGWLYEQLREADVFLTSWTNRRLGEAGLGYEEARSGVPGLVYCSVTPWGPHLPEPGFPGYEPLVLAKAGRFAGNDRVGGSHYAGRPIMLTAPFSSYAAAMLAVEGVAAGLFQRERDGRGSYMETSLIDGISAGTMRLKLRRGAEADAAQASAQSDLVHRGIGLCFLTAECSDGRYIQMCARQDHHFRNWLAALGRRDLLADPRFSGAPLGLKSYEDADALEAELRKEMRQRTQAEWMHEFIQNWDVGADPFLTFEEFLEHEQMVANDRVVQLEDPDHGVILQLGPLAQYSRTPSRVRLGTPRTPESTERWKSIPATEPDQAGQARSLPLEGVTIIEAAYYLAAPLGLTLLAELGARVIKVEPLNGDPYRRSGIEVVHILHGKQSIAVDLKTARGQEILGRLVAGANALVHSFRTDKTPALGLDYDRIREINPNIVYLYAASYGSRGPQSQRPAFHSTPHALSGGGILQGGEGNPPVDDSYGDPCSGLAVAASLALALLEQRRSGRGQYVETMMLASAGYVLSEYLMSFPAKSSTRVLTSDQLGFDSIHRLYQASDESWVCVWGEREEELTALLQLTGIDPEGAVGDNGRLGQELASAFRGRPAAEWEQLASALRAPVAAVAASREDFLVDSGLVRPRQDDVHGPYWQLLPRVRMGGKTTRKRPASPPPQVGENTLSLLREIGYDDEEIADLYREAVVR